jgi:hypothetical protein
MTVKQWKENEEVEIEERDGCYMGFLWIENIKIHLVLSEHNE